MGGVIVRDIIPSVSDEGTEAMENIYDINIYNIWGNDSFEPFISDKISLETYSLASVRIENFYQMWIVEDFEFKFITININGFQFENTIV